MRQLTHHHRYCTMRQVPRMRQPAHLQGQFTLRQLPSQQKTAAIVNNALAYSTTEPQPTVKLQHFAGKMLTSFALLLIF